jgi:hypothetical protein
MQFQTKNQISSAMNIINNTILIQNTTKLKFLGLLTNSTMTLKKHIEMIIPTLNQACFVLKIVRSILSLQSLKLVYHFNILTPF